jgi:hypothetical protein
MSPTHHHDFPVMLRSDLNRYQTVIYDARTLIPSLLIRPNNPLTHLALPHDWETNGEIIPVVYLDDHASHAKSSDLVNFLNAHGIMPGTWHDVDPRQSVSAHSHQQHQPTLYASAQSTFPRHIKKEEPAQPPAYIWPTDTWGQVQAVPQMIHNAWTQHLPPQLHHDPVLNGLGSIFGYGTNVGAFGDMLKSHLPQPYR